MFHAMVPGRDEEEAELTRMMDEWGGLVLGLCAVTLKDGHLAQDAAQETFVKAWSHRADWPNLQNRRAWLARIAVNTCRDMQRGGWFRHVTRKQTLDDLSGLAAPETSQREVMEAVNALPREQRQIVLLRFWQNLSGEEIAECLGLSRSAVYRKMDKAKKNLRLTLEGEDVPRRKSSFGKPCGTVCRTLCRKRSSGPFSPGSEKGNSL